MTRLKQLECFIADNGGSVTASEVRDARFSPSLLAVLLKNGTVERETRGVYVLADTLIDEYTTIAARWKRCVFSYGTALYLLGLSDRTPSIIDVTLPRGYNPRNLLDEYPQIRVHYVYAEVYDIGRTKLKTPTGTAVPAYDAERSICDLLKARRTGKVDMQLFNTAITGYFKGHDRDMRKLSTYARRLGVEDDLHRYTEVLL